MTNQEKWPIGTRVKFTFDDLSAKGTLITDKGSTVVVLLDKDCRGGWRIEDAYDNPSREYYGRYGWNVPYDRLEACQTKLGNEL